MMINLKACFSKHSRWPPEGFRLAGLESSCCSTAPSLDWPRESFRLAGLESLCCSTVPSLDV
ncbi:hypothetical protein MUK42_15345 [Musa troglodytarum]|uniref:Uncharacterized protein n=1 Tax=Musa troglodytarum TaxID=320322 RepID=A0A9E7KKB8_9LILI|nr:hypothetical protein MUK42_15345 [Musa troglodytarum]